MSRTERFGGRPWAWSVFHRSMPKPAYMIDLDYIECCQFCKEPLFIAETAKDIGQPYKATTILLRLAKRSEINSYLIFYNEELIKPLVEKVMGTEAKTLPILGKDQLALLWQLLHDSTQVVARIKKIYPGNGEVREFTAAEYYTWLSSFHTRHEKDCTSLDEQEKTHLIARV